jgi:hypothetical protein
MRRRNLFLRMGNVDLALESMEKYQMVHDSILLWPKQGKLMNCKPNTENREKKTM